MHRFVSSHHHYRDSFFLLDITGISHAHHFVLKMLSSTACHLLSDTQKIYIPELQASYKEPVIHKLLAKFGEGTVMTFQSGKTVFHTKTFIMKWLTLGNNYKHIFNSILSTSVQCTAVYWFLRCGVHFHFIWE